MKKRLYGELFRAKFSGPKRVRYAQRSKPEDAAQKRPISFVHCRVCKGITLTLYRMDRDNGEPFYFCGADYVKVARSIAQATVKEEGGKKND